MSSTFVVGEEAAARRALEGLASSGVEARAFIPPRDDAPGSSRTLGRCLLELERELERDRPELVLLADASDASLAAAIVAAKLLLAVEAGDGATGDDLNARLIAQLAPTRAAAR